MNRVIRQFLISVLATVFVFAATAFAQDRAQQQMQRFQVRERERLEYERQMQEAQTGTRLHQGGTASNMPAGTAGASGRGRGR